MDAYRFSISWPRVLGGDLDYYERLVDGLLGAGVEPVPTLFHWDLPQSLEDAGGWLSPETASHFGEYAEAVAARLADRVERWITLNEPREVTMLGHALGVHAPGHQLGFDAVPVAHELLRAHAAGAQALRSHGVRSIGVAASHAPIWPLSDSEEDREAAGLFDLLNNWLFADPLLAGRYPAELADLMPGEAPARDLDWYGVNYYNPIRVGAAGESTVDGIDIGGLPFGFGEIDAPRTDFGWPVVPEGLTETLRMLDQRHPGTSYVITENGASYAAMDDGARIDFLQSHLAALHRAIEEGVDVRGYFHWSLMDNFEWAEGFSQHFGLTTRDRTERTSFAWLCDWLRG